MFSIQGEPPDLALPESPFTWLEWSGLSEWAGSESTALNDETLVGHKKNPVLAQPQEVNVRK